MFVIIVHGVNVDSDQEKFLEGTNEDDLFYAYDMGLGEGVEQDMEPINTKEDIQIVLRFDKALSRRIRNLTKFSGRENEAQTVFHGVEVLAWLASEVGNGYVKCTKENGYKLRLAPLNVKEDEEVVCKEVILEL